MVVNQTMPVFSVFRNSSIVSAREAARNNPTTSISNNTPLDDQRKIELSQVFFRTFGWLGGPWTLYSNTIGININENQTIIVTNDSVHDHHVHLSVGREQG